jgi:hypothetical protein
VRYLSIGGRRNHDEVDAFPPGLVDQAQLGPSDGSRRASLDVRLPSCGGAADQLARS